MAEASKKIGYEFEGSLIGDKSNSVVFDNSKLKRAVPGFTPNVRFEEGIRSTVKWYIDNEKWWRDILSGDYKLERLGQID